MMRRRGLGSGEPPLRGVAVDLGSARVKPWAPDRRGPVEVRTADVDGSVLVRRGAIVDVAAIASLLEGLLPVRAFDEIFDELDVTALDFEQRVKTLLADLSQHIDRENLGIFPVSVVTLGAEGWETVARAHAEKDHYWD